MEGFSVSTSVSLTVEELRRAGAAVPLSPCVRRRIADLRAQRRALTRSAGAAAPARSFQPDMAFLSERERLVAIIAERQAAEALALVGILAFLLATLIVFLAFGDAPGIDAARAGVGL
jgi:hypothetical protein